MSLRMTTKFLDGPAAGVELSLGRTPVMLRVVQNRAGVWDALDQLNDEPKPQEKIYVYRVVPGTQSGMVHVQYSTGRGRRGQWMQGADYTALLEQPADEDVRTNDRWRAWCNMMQSREAAERQSDGQRNV